jgi:hypothetical protein
MAICTDNVCCAVPAAVPVKPEVTGKWQGRKVCNTSDQVNTLARLCTDRQIGRNERARNFVVVASFVAMLFVGIVAGSFLTPVAGVFIGLATYLAFSSVLDGIFQCLLSRSYEKAALALGDPNFLEFANETGIPLNMDTILSAHKAFLDITEAHISHIRTESLEG